MGERRDGGSGRPRRGRRREMRARGSVPTCPDPPGMTTFITLLRSLDEAASEFRARHQALFVPAEHAIPVSSDDVVQRDRGSPSARLRTTRSAFQGHPSWPATNSAASLFVTIRASRRSKVCDDVERRQILRVAAPALTIALPVALWSEAKSKTRAAIVHEEKLQEAVAQSADAVVEDQVSAFGRRTGLALTNRAMF